MNPTSESERTRSPSNALGELVGQLRRRFERTVYVDARDAPEEPMSPYRARLSVPTQEQHDGVEVNEREVVRGTLRVVYEIRCACGRRWFNQHRERVQVCPRCACAVLLDSTG
jgi:hypothetical protein